MYAVSSAFKQQVRQSHKATVRVEVWQGDQRLVSLEPIDGSVEIDARRAVRRTCSLSVAAPEPTTALEQVPGTSTYADLTLLYTNYPTMASQVATYALLAPAGEYRTVLVDSGVIPADAYGYLTPYGNELRIWRGIELPDGTVEEVPLGVFVIVNVEIQETGTGATVSVSGADRSLRISRAKWTEPYAIRSTSTETAITNLLSDRWFDVETSFSTTGVTVGKATFGTEANSDPWADALKLAQSAGHDLYFDGNGIAVLEPTRDYESTSPDEVYLQDDEAMVLGLTRSLNADDTYNGVIATGEGTDLPDVYRGEAWDDDPDSPTYRYGAFGLVPRFYSSSLFASSAQAQAGAEAMLAKGKGLTEQINWTQITDPSLDAGDVVVVVNENAKVNRTLVLDRLTIPLNPIQPMNAVARAIRFGVTA